MSLFPKTIYDKHCFVPCPPDRCDCKVGNPEAWAAQESRRLAPDPCDVSPFNSQVCSRGVKGCRAIHKGSNNAADSVGDEK